VYEKSDGLGTLAPRGGELDAMTRLFVNILPNLYHWGVVNPIYRLCGKWIKVRRTKKQRKIIDCYRNQSQKVTIMVLLRQQRALVVPLAPKTITNHITSSQSSHLPHLTTRQHSTLAQKVLRRNHLSMSKPASSSTATHISIALQLFSAR
jgi:hypothetical protein